jgi:hypothetical protein
VVDTSFVSFIMAFRLLIVLVVLSTTVALRQPAVVQAAAPQQATLPAKSSWSQRLAMDWSRAITRRATFRPEARFTPPPLQPVLVAAPAAEPVAARLNLHHVSLPPPLA